MLCTVELHFYVIFNAVFGDMFLYKSAGMQVFNRVIHILCTLFD